jgi:hypothetical protein
VFAQKQEWHHLRVRADRARNLPWFVLWLHNALHGGSNLQGDSCLVVCCSTSRGLHFWEVVPLDVLLGQLAIESQGGSGGGSTTAQKLHQLLVPSYFPGPEEGVVSSHFGRAAVRTLWHVLPAPPSSVMCCRLLLCLFLMRKLMNLRGTPSSSRAGTPTGLSGQAAQVVSCRCSVAITLSHSLHVGRRTPAG